MKSKQVIRLAVSTGHSTGTHLHYEPLVYINAGIRLKGLRESSMVNFNI